MRRPEGPPPTDEEILRHANVPVALAARYVGSGRTTLQYALQQGRAPFGFAGKGEKVWYYNICAEALVRYKHGDVPVYGLKDLLGFAAEEIMQILDAKLTAAKRSMDAA